MLTSAYDPDVGGSRTVETTTLMSGGAHTHRRIAWPAIFAGVVLAVSIQILFTLLGAGIGFGTVDVVRGSTPDASSLGIGAGVWWVVSSFVALFIGGYSAAWLAGIEIRFDGLLHGLVTWGISTLLIMWLLTSAIGGIVGTGFSALGSVASAAGGGISEAAKPIAQAAGVSPDMIQQQADAYLQPASQDPATMSPQGAQKQVASNLITYAQGGPGAAAAKQRVVAIMAAQGKISQAAAEQKFDTMQAEFEQKRNQAIQVARNAADSSAAAASKTSFALFGVLLINLVGAAIGGALAVQRRRRTVERTVG